MSWLKFNDSLNNLKGQITNFANNVLTDDEGIEQQPVTDYEALRKQCIRYEAEIEELKGLNKELKHTQKNGSESWNWDTNMLPNSDEASSLDNSSSKLQQQVAELQAEKNNLITQLEQLDLENQQNLSEILRMKEKLQEENSDLQDEIDKFKQELNKVKIKNEKLNSELEEIQKPSNSRDGYKEKYENLLQINRTLKSDQDELKKEDIMKSNEKIKQLEAENKLIYAELQRAKQDMKDFQQKSFEDTETCEKLASILEAYEKQVVTLKEELEYERNNKREDTSDKKLIDQLREELKDAGEVHDKISNSLKTDMDKIKSINEELQLANNKLSRELESVSENHEMQIKVLLEEVAILKAEKSHMKIGEDALIETKRQLDDVRKSLENLSQDLHKKYINIITDNIKKVQDCTSLSDFHNCSHGDSPQISEFSKQVENIVKILLDFKCKCDALERQVYNLSEEKTNILKEKNEEIEKLIQNSDMLSQEVMTKSQAIKDYENECSELAKNNELLINELETYKSSTGLQTISESNEDNMVLLESQLENANKRIEDLEKIIDDFENQQKQAKTPEAENEEQLEVALQQLTLTETEITNKQKDYGELLNSFDELQIEYDTLKSDLELIRGDLTSATQEKEILKSDLEKIKTDYENTEYQLSEMNINADSLSEEIECYKKRTDSLSKENGRLQMLNEESSKNFQDIRLELDALKANFSEEENNRKKFEIQVRTLTEKLQNAKMNETSLKLQYDTVSKEAMALSESKHNLEALLQKVNTELVQFQNSYVELQRQHNKLGEDYDELKRIETQREEQIKNFEELVGDLQNKLEKYEKLAVDENEDLLKKLTLEDNCKVIEELKQRLSKYEAVAMDESEHLFKNLTLKEKETNLMDVDVNVREIEELKQQHDSLLEDRNNLQKQVNELLQVKHQLEESIEIQNSLQQQLQEVTKSRNDLINIVTTKHQESVAYHNEIQRLTQILNMETQKCKNFELELNELKNAPKPDEIEMKNLEVEKLADQNNFLREKCEIMARNLLEEQSKVQQLLTEKSNPSEKEISLQKNVERLQSHLIELEEHYTQELLQAEQKSTELQQKISQAEEREKSSSNMYTSVSIRANQQVESLQSQLLTVIAERDSLRNKISDAEDLNNKQAAALTNLQFVLEQFQKDKEKDVMKETERIRRQVNAEKQIQEELKKEITSLKSQLEESKQGLQAACRLSDQLDHSKKLVVTLKEEAAQLQEKLTKCEENLKKTTSQTDGKVDKSLIKNLVIGFICSNNNLNKDQRQILKIIATVLDFNQQDHDKVKLNVPQPGSWLGSFLAPQSNTQNMTQESLSQAFIKFLENESKPRVVPSLLNASTSEAETSQSTSKSNTPRQSPIILSEIVLPTFADFPQSRNSSSILKDVLKNNNT